MKIGIIGAGAIGKAFAKQVANAGYEVVISNSRGAESLKELVSQLGENVTAGSVAEAATAEVIFLALQWQHLEQVTQNIDWNGKIVIDPTNPILPGFKLANLGNKASSEVVQKWTSGARLVKAFNTLQPEILAANPMQGGGKRVIFYSGDYNDAKDIVSGIINRLGFAGIDLGRLNEGGKLQQFPGGALPTLNLIKI
jgi:predicted dinucleotide-binding enzyme